MMMTFISMLWIRLSAYQTSNKTSTLALGSLVLPVPHKQLNGLPYESFSVYDDALRCLIGYSHVISVFALTVMGTFEVLTAAHTPALSNCDLAMS